MSYFIFSSANYHSINVPYTYKSSIITTSILTTSLNKLQRKNKRSTFRRSETIAHNYKQITGKSADASVWIDQPRGCQLAELKCIGRDASFDAERRPRYQWTPERRGCKVAAICVREKQVGDKWPLRNSFMCFLNTCRPKYMQVSQQQRTFTCHNIYLL